MTNRKQPPYDENAERGVLGGILLDGYRVMDMAREYHLTPEAFLVPAHRLVFSAILALSDKNADMIDVLTVGSKLKSDGDLDKVGGNIFLDQIIESTPTAAHSEYYVQIVSEKWRLREIIHQCRETEEECYQEADDDISVLVATHSANIQEIEAKFIREEIPWSKTVDDGMERIEGILETKEGLTGISTGFNGIDNAVLGLKERELTIFAARPSQGKTSLAMNIAENVADDGHPVGVFSLEMGREELAMRMKCSRAKVDIWSLLRGKVQGYQGAALSKAAVELRELPLVVDDRAGLDIEQVKIKARRWVKKYGIKLLIVDYLQLLSCEKKAKQSRQVEVSAISGGLKQIAKENDIPVLALAQLSRKPEDRKDGRPVISDLRESGSIEQDADNVWLMHRPSRYPDAPECNDELLAIVDVAKQRNGPTGDARLEFVQEYTQFRDPIPKTSNNKDTEEIDHFGADYD